MIVNIHYRDTGEFFQRGAVVSETEDKVKVRLLRGLGHIIFRKASLISVFGLLYIESSYFFDKPKMCS